MASDDPKESTSHLPKADWLIGSEDEAVDFTALRKTPGKGTPSPRPNTVAKPPSEPSPWVADFLLDQVAGTRADLRQRRPSSTQEPSDRRPRHATEHQAKMRPAQPGAASPDDTFDRAQEPSVTMPRAASPSPISIGAMHSRIVHRRHVAQAGLALALLGGLYGLSGSPLERPETERVEARGEPIENKPWSALPASVAEALSPDPATQLAAIAEADGLSVPTQPPNSVLVLPSDAVTGHQESTALTASIQPTLTPLIEDPVLAASAPPQLARIEPARAIPSAAAPGISPVVSGPRRNTRIEAAPALTTPRRQPHASVKAQDASEVVAAIEEARALAPATEPRIGQQAEPVTGSDEAGQITSALRPQDHGEPQGGASTRRKRTAATALQRPTSPHIARAGQRQAIALPALLRPTPF